MAEIVRRKSWGGVLPLGRHASIRGSSFIQCASVSIALSSVQEGQTARHHKQFKLEQALAWLERDWLGDHLHLLVDDVGYAREARRRLAWWPHAGRGGQGPARCCGHRGSAITRMRLSALPPVAAEA